MLNIEIWKEKNGRWEWLVQDLDDPVDGKSASGSSNDYKTASRCAFIAYCQIKEEEDVDH